jgi:AcrR family transcriptional regulator
MKKIGLRERKSAKLKVGLAETMVELLEQRPLEEIAIRELCEAHEISEATFFNYFPRKQDVLSYFIQLWSLEMAWVARQAQAETGGMEAIEAIFDYGAGQWAQYPAFMGEMLAYQARLREWPQSVEIGLAERLQAFPDMDGIEDIPSEGLDSILSGLLGRAIEQGQLPQETDREVVILALVSLFFGVPMQMRLYEPERIGEIYHRELQLLWHGLDIK